jgi:hypothetical protein
VESCLRSAPLKISSRAVSNLLTPRLGRFGFGSSGALGSSERCGSGRYTLRLERGPSLYARYHTRLARLCAPLV